MIDIDAAIRQFEEFDNSNGFGLLVRGQMVSPAGSRRKVWEFQLYRTNQPGSQNVQPGDIQLATVNSGQPMCHNVALAWVMEQLVEPFCDRIGINAPATDPQTVSNNYTGGTLVAPVVWLSELAHVG